MNCCKHLPFKLKCESCKRAIKRWQLERAADDLLGETNDRRHYEKRTREAGK